MGLAGIGMLSKLAPSGREEQSRLVKRLAEIESSLSRLQDERVETKRRLEEIRIQNTNCPKCGREKDFLTDDEGVLVHVLEDPDDVELLSPGKPLYCPACGDVFIYAGPAKSSKKPA